MPDDGLVRSVKRFDGKNYQSWKFQITAVLMANEIFDVVDGTRRRPPNGEGPNAANMKSWIKDNARATAIISSAMEDDQVMSVLVCGSAKEMWDKLVTIHEQKSAANVGTLTQRFYSYKMSPSDSVIQHVSTVQNMARQLKDLGETMSDAAVIAKILSSLTTRFSVFKTAWDSVDPTRQTVENLLERLIREDQNLGEDGNSASALAVTKQGALKDGAKSKDKDRKKRKPRKNIECYRCQEKGHYASQCDKRKNQNDNNNNTKGQAGSSCAFVVDSHERGGEASRQLLPSVGQIRQLSEADKREVWITDSGASEHITSRRDWFEELRSVTGETVLLGDDGECEVTGIGKIRIEKYANGEWNSGVIENVLLVPRVTRNLFSVGVCTKKGFRVGFENGVVEVSRGGVIEATGARQENGLYRMFFRRPKPKREVNVTSLDFKIWHERLGHIHKRALTELHVVFNERAHRGDPKTSESEIELTLPSSSDDDGEEDEQNAGHGNGAAVGNAGADDVAAGNSGSSREAQAVREGGIENVEVQQQQQQQQQQEALTPRSLRNRDALRPPARYALYCAEYNVPTTYQEAITSPEASQWAEAIEDELDAHRTNGTWIIVPRVPGEKTIDSRWVFKILRDTDGNVKKYKARLCARGFKQREGVDYFETFSPVVRYDSLRVLLAVITQADLEVMQFDVRTAFLHGELDEDIRMELPTGLVVNEEAGDRRKVVCLLKKSLYGLKQAPRCWNIKFTEFLKRFNLKEIDADSCVFYGIFDGYEVYLAAFVDDGIIAAKSLKVIYSIIGSLNEAFELTLGDCSSFVGIQIERDRASKSMFVHQSAYARKIIEKFGMSKAKEVSVPADPHTILYPVESGESERHNVPYREAVGSLMFLAVVTRPDLAYAVNATSKFLNNHNESHWQAVKRIIAYLIGTIDVGIEYRASESGIELTGYSDADFASDVETRRSTTGYAFCVANGIVTWSSQRQRLVSMSTTESEYIAAATAAKEAVWLRTLLSGIGYNCDKPTKLYVDNQSAIRLVRNPEFHKRTKHIDIKYHYIREKVENREIDVVFVPTEAQLADMFTKALSRNRFIELCTNLGISVKRSDGGSVKAGRRI
ncbi:uncharacterized protein [Temnothorax nylanderi]|uniref:uncharacterized protein n=1 Tax=Temnothorax nylanderi TaxID=102681 RepID=UPI003A847F90